MLPYDVKVFVTQRTSMLLLSVGLKTISFSGHTCCRVYSKKLFVVAWTSRREKRRELGENRLERETPQWRAVNEYI